MEDPEQKSTKDLNVDNVLKIIKTLRGENGCPWDKKQTPRSIVLYLIEEAYELLDAIDSNNTDNVCEELGDVLFQVLFIAELFDEKGIFNISDVLDLNAKKMIRRHPHVYGDEKVKNADEVLQRWHKIKLEEKNIKSDESVLDSIPKSMPALMRAYKILERAAKEKFGLSDISQILLRIEENWIILKKELNKKSVDNNLEMGKQNLGDILFGFVNISRFMHIHPENVLFDAVKKFEADFRNFEQS